MNFRILHRHDGPNMVSLSSGRRLQLDDFQSPRPPLETLPNESQFCCGASLRMVQKLKSRGLTIVIVEHSAKPLVLSYSAVRRDRLHWNNETILESLMIPFQMIMRHKLSYRIP